jgi:hypothetical protein
LALGGINDINLSKVLCADKTGNERRQTWLVDARRWFNSGKICTVENLHGARLYDFFVVLFQV